MQEHMLLKKKVAVAVKTKLLMHFNGDYVDQAGHTGAATAGTSFLSNQKFGQKALTCTTGGFSGFQTNVPNFSDFTLPGDFTIEAYCSLGAVTQEQMLLSAGPGTYIDFYTGSQYNSGQPGILVSMQSTNSHVGMLQVQHGWAANAIHHLAVARQNGTVSIFLDGVWKQSVANSNPWINGGALIIGNYYSSVAYGWTGGIQEMRLSNVCRYPGTTTFTPPTGPFTLD